MTHGVYLHIPFCTHRCAYCDFNTYAGLESLIPSYIEALCAEARMVGAAWPEGEPRGVDTIFFGGGTPSLLPAKSLRRILGTLRGAFDVETGAEITLEANPGTVTRAALGALREAGINRLSLGAQSADPSILRLLERAHDFGQVEAAVREARSAGFDNLNLDLMLGVMTQTMESWRELAAGRARFAPGAPLAVHAERRGGHAIGRSGAQWNPPGARAGPGS